MQVVWDTCAGQRRIATPNCDLRHLAFAQLASLYATVLRATASIRIHRGILSFHHRPSSETSAGFQASACLERGFDEGFLGHLVEEPAVLLMHSDLFAAIVARLIKCHLGDASPSERRVLQGFQRNVSEYVARMSSTWMMRKQSR